MALQSGTYVSEDGIHTIIIDTIDPNHPIFPNASFNGEFSTTTPLGDMTYDKSHNFKGYCDYTADKNLITVCWSGWYRSSSWGNVMLERWVGYTDTYSRQLIMSGSRSFTNVGSNSPENVYSFEHVIFNRQDERIPGIAVDTDSLDGKIYNLEKDPTTEIVSVKIVNENYTATYIPITYDNEYEPVSLSVQGDYDKDGVHDINVLLLRKNDGVFFNVIKTLDGKEIKIIDNSATI